MTYHAGVGIRDITPSQELIAAGKIWLWGYGNRSDPCSGVYSKISARALVINDGGETTIVLATVDVGALDPNMTAKIRTRIHERFGIDAEYVCLNVSHTHGAPVPVSIPTFLD